MAFVLDQVRVELPPEEMVVGLADSVTVGAAGFTVTVAVWVAAAPAAFVTVREYIVVTGGVTLTVCPLVTAMFPGAMTPVPLAKTAVKLEELPVVIAAGLAVKLPRPRQRASPRATRLGINFMRSIDAIDRNKLYATAHLLCPLLR